MSDGKPQPDDEPDEGAGPSRGYAIALIVWMYLLAAIALVGCEFNAEMERLAESRMLPTSAVRLTPRSRG